MKIEVIFNHSDSLSVRVSPWPDAPFAADIAVRHTKIDYFDSKEFPRRTGDVGVRYGQSWLTPQGAREFAEALLAACDIADEMAAGTFDPTRFSPDFQLSGADNGAAASTDKTDPAS